MLRSSGANFSKLCKGFPCKIPKIWFTWLRMTHMTSKCLHYISNKSIIINHPKPAKSNQNQSKTLKPSATTHNHPQPSKNQNLAQLKSTVNYLSSAEKPIQNLLFLVWCLSGNS